MKKIIGILFITLILCGCSMDMDNTPTKQVENFLSEYQNAGDSVMEDIREVVNGEVNFTEDQRTSYEEILKKHFQDLTYKVKEETVDGDMATVEVEIEVNDYYKVNEDANIYLIENPEEFYGDNDEYDNSLFVDYRLKQFKENKERVKYTIYFIFHKVYSKWQLDELTEEQQEKLLGTYAH